MPGRNPQPERLTLVDDDTQPIEELLETIQPSRQRHHDVQHLVPQPLVPGDRHQRLLDTGGGAAGDSGNTSARRTARQRAPVRRTQS